MLVEELLDREGVYSKGAGKDILVKCLSPEHEDSSPSMRIDRITGMFNCFSCGFKGNIFTHYGEALDTLGIRIIQIKKKIANLRSNEMLLPLGCEPFKRDHRNISGKTYDHFEAFIHDNYEGRIVFPIKDITGKLLGLLGRYAFSEASPKYLWDPPLSEQPVFPPSPDIYKDSIIVVEGIFDVLNLWDKGLTNVVCTFGKSMGETKKKAKKAQNLNKFIPLKIQGAKRVYVLYDSGASSSSLKLKNMLEPLFFAESINYPLFSKDKDAGNLTQSEVDDLKRFLYEENHEAHCNS
jgi:DNA primase